MPVLLVPTPCTCSEHTSLKQKCTEESDPRHRPSESDFTEDRQAEIAFGPSFAATDLVWMLGSVSETSLWQRIQKPQTAEELQRFSSDLREAIPRLIKRTEEATARGFHVKYGMLTGGRELGKFPKEPVSAAKVCSKMMEAVGWCARTAERGLGVRVDVETS